MSETTTGALFEGLGLHPDLLRAVQTMGFVEPTPIQAQTIPLALEGGDVLGCAQTGSGKTAAFALPILNTLKLKPGNGLRALILVPTRELAEQVNQTFKDCGRFIHIKTAVVIGGVGYHGQRLSVRQGAQILVATPGRLLDHLQQGSFNLGRVEHVVLDEADRMLDMGFLPSIRAVFQHLPHERQTMMFSATLHSKVGQIAAFALRNPKRVEVAKPTATAEGISQVVYPVDQFQKADFLVALLRAVQMKSVLVFCRTRQGADRLTRRLIAAGFSTGILHASKTQSQRTRAMEDFRQGKIQILVATDIAARGIDVREISHVINFDVPRYPEDYVHRVGRTARAYSIGDAVTLMDITESSFLMAIERFTGLIFPRAMLPNFPYAHPPRLEPSKPRPPSGPSGRRFGRRFLPRRLGR
ncbi:MAG: DEAD/DEAH box helicase [Elusimicrobia bacterium]|nr:DEAD/DEAH box helicase [Elusimicrobiota bacterium]